MPIEKYDSGIEGYDLVIETPEGSPGVKHLTPENAHRIATVASAVLEAARQQSEKKGSISGSDDDAASFYATRKIDVYSDDHVEIRDTSSKDATIRDKDIRFEDQLAVQVKETISHYQGSDSVLRSEDLMDFTVAKVAQLIPKFIREQSVGVGALGALGEPPKSFLRPLAGRVSYPPQGAAAQSAERISPGLPPVYRGSPQDAEESDSATTTSGFGTDTSASERSASTKPVRSPKLRKRRVRAAESSGFQKGKGVSPAQKWIARTAPAAPAAATWAAPLSASQQLPPAASPVPPPPPAAFRALSVLSDLSEAESPRPPAQQLSPVPPPPAAPARLSVALRPAPARAASGSSGAAAFDDVRRQTPSPAADNAQQQLPLEDLLKEEEAPGSSRSSASTPAPPPAADDAQQRLSPPTTAAAASSRAASPAAGDGFLRSIRLIARTGNAELQRFKQETLLDEGRETPEGSDAGVQGQTEDASQLLDALQREVQESEKVSQEVKGLEEARKRRSMEDASPRASSLAALGSIPPPERGDADRREGDGDFDADLGDDDTATLVSDSQVKGTELLRLRLPDSPSPPPVREALVSAASQPAEALEAAELEEEAAARAGGLPSDVPGGSAALFRPLSSLSGSSRAELPPQLPVAELSQTPEGSAPLSPADEEVASLTSSPTQQSPAPPAFAVTPVATGQEKLDFMRKPRQAQVQRVQELAAEQVSTTSQRLREQREASKVAPQLSAGVSVRLVPSKSSQGGDEKLVKSDDTSASSRIVPPPVLPFAAPREQAPNQEGAWQHGAYSVGDSGSTFSRPSPPPFRDKSDADIQAKIRQVENEEALVRSLLQRLQEIERRFETFKEVEAQESVTTAAVSGSAAEIISLNEQLANLEDRIADLRARKKSSDGKESIPGLDEVGKKLRDLQLKRRSVRFSDPVVDAT